ncbi:hypothetical protein PAPYR_11460 [Paratrimastix pyriformis]|uniref:Uncharacterized protein n=1 Tax=Paratrimastix pyriformis TaxID=342808 RepID=A0ABQ8U3P9_9EUKA|nr:hypothetical protein PAPYR_11460 [Paratrimastix pyriformis]
MIDDKIKYEIDLNAFKPAFVRYLGLYLKRIGYTAMAKTVKREDTIERIAKAGINHDWSQWTDADNAVLKTWTTNAGIDASLKLAEQGDLATLTAMHHLPPPIDGVWTLPPLPVGAAPPVAPVAAKRRAVAKPAATKVVAAKPVVVTPDVAEEEFVDPHAAEMAEAAREKAARQFFHDALAGRIPAAAPAERTEVAQPVVKREEPVAVTKTAVVETKPRAVDAAAAANPFAALDNETERDRKLREDSERLERVEREVFRLSAMLAQLLAISAPGEVAHAEPRVEELEDEQAHVEIEDTKEAELHEVDPDGFAEYANNEKETLRCSLCDHELNAKRGDPIAKQAASFRSHAKAGTHCTALKERFGEVDTSAKHNRAQPAGKQAEPKRTKSAPVLDDDNDVAPVPLKTTGQVKAYIATLPLVAAKGEPLKSGEKRGTNSTSENYASALVSLLAELPVAQRTPDFYVHKDEMCRIIEAKQIKEASKARYYLALAAVTRGLATPDSSLVRFYYRHVKQIIGADTTPKNRMSTDRVEKFVPWNRLVKRQRALLQQFETEVQLNPELRRLLDTEDTSFTAHPAVSHKLDELSRNAFITSVYTLLPTCREKEIRELQKREPADTADANWIDWTKRTIMRNGYKMEGKRGMTVIKMPNTLYRLALARAYISSSVYLLPNGYNEVMTTQFGKKIGDAFGNTNLTSDVIRMIFSTTFADTRSDPEVAHYMDEVMGHAADTHNAIYIKRHYLGANGEEVKVTEDFIRGGEGEPEVSWLDAVPRLARKHAQKPSSE